MPDLKAVGLLTHLEKISFGPKEAEGHPLSWEECELMASKLFELCETLEQVRVQGRHGAVGFLPSTASLRQDRSKQSALGFLAGIDPLEMAPLVKESDEGEWRCW